VPVSAEDVSFDFPQPGDGSFNSPNIEVGGLAQMRRRPVKTGWQLLGTIAVSYSLLFLSTSEAAAEEGSECN